MPVTALNGQPVAPGGKQYLDPSTGEPIPAQKTYLDPNTGEPVKDATTAPPSTDSNQSWWDRVTAPYTKIQKPDPNDRWNPKEAVKAVGNIGAGGLGVLLHPINALAGVGGLVTAPFEAAQGKRTVYQDMYEGAKDNPYGMVEAGIGQAGAAPFLSKELSAPVKAIRAIPKVARGAMDIMAGATPKVAAGLAEDTTTANAAATAKAEAANTAIQSKRAQQLQQHFEKTQQVRAQNEAAQAVQSRKVALQRGVEQLDPKFQEDLQTTEKNVRAQANEKYNTVRAATEGETIPSESLANAVKTAEGKIQGSSENLKIFRDILSKHPEGEPESITYQGAQIPKGHPLYDVLKEGEAANTSPATFSDLQGYYSELGSKLAQGNLPGDVYQAMKTLQGSVGDLMQQMAESKGVGDQLTDARGFYRDYMNAFRDSKSPLNKAMNAPERGKSIAALKGADQSGIETLARYNPELAQRANTIRGYQAEAKSIPAKAPAVKPEPALPPKPAPVLADVKKIGLGDIKQAKTDAMMNTKKIGGLAGASMHGAGVWHFVQSAVHGSPGGMLGGAAIAGTPYVLGKIFKTPAIVRMLSEPTPADIAAIPPEIRADMPQIVQAAQKQGIKVHPALLMMGRPNAPQQ